MAYYTTNEKIYPFLGDHRRGFELFWQTAYVLHLEGRKTHSSHRGAGFGVLVTTGRKITISSKWLFVNVLRKRPIQRSF